MKKILCLILALGFAVFAVGCGPEIADTNGPDDYSLAEITEENIINQDLGCSGYTVSPASDDENYMVKLTKVLPTLQEVWVSVFLFVNLSFLLTMAEFTLKTT